MVCQCASRCILATVNTIFALIAVIATVVGGFFTWNITIIYNLLREHVYPNMNGVGDTEQQRAAIESIIRMLSPFGLTIFIFGIILLVLCCLGLAGACLNNRCLLSVYLSLQGVLLIAEMIVIILYLVKPTIITDNAKVMLEDSVNQYVSINSTDVHSSLLTFMMPALKCCGVMNGTDFDNSKSFRREVTYNGQKITLKYPIPCCKFDKSYQPMSNCPNNFTVQNSNYQSGCWPVLQSEIDRYGHIVVYVCVGVVVLQIFLVIASLILICRRKKSDSY